MQQMREGTRFRLIPIMGPTFAKADTLSVCVNIYMRERER